MRTYFSARARRCARLLVAVTARHEEIDAGHPLGELVAAVQVMRRFSEIELHRLDRSETALLAERMSGAPLAGAEIERLFDDSEGIPLFIVEPLWPGAPAAEGRRPDRGQSKRGGIDPESRGRA